MAMSVLITGLYACMISSLYVDCVVLTAVGCTNMIPPDNAWLKRADNDIVIGCYMSQQTWQLQCDGLEWKGLVGECAESCEIFVGFLLCPI